MKRISQKDKFVYPEKVLRGAIVGIYETYMDGKPRKSNRKDGDKHHKRGRGTKKIQYLA